MSWIGGALLIVAGDVLLLRGIVARRHPVAANVLAAGLALGVVALTLRSGILLGRYHP